MNSNEGSFDPGLPEAGTWTILALYQFKSFPNYKDVRVTLQRFCNSIGLKGTLLIALEGINGTVAGSEKAISDIKEFLSSGDLGVAFDAMSLKESFSDVQPFLRMKVKLKEEIVTLGVPEVDPNKSVGRYANSEEWNELVKDPETLVIDTRNDYEYQVGTFDGAVNPNTKSFREFPAYVESNYKPGDYKRVAMFCTGGIRCEKATSYMLLKGFKEVYHLEGGILKYLEDTPAEESLWQGECFVFDDRVTVTQDLSPGSYDMCHGCRRPITESDKAHEDYVKGVSCPYCVNEKNSEQKKRYAERQKQMDLSAARNCAHLGVNQRTKSAKSG